MGWGLKALVAVGVLYGANCAGRFGYISVLESRLERAEVQFERDWRELSGCPFDLVRDYSRLESDLKQGIQEQERLAVVPFYRILANE